VECVIPQLPKLLLPAPSKLFIPVLERNVHFGPKTLNLVEMWGTAPQSAAASVVICVPMYATTIPTIYTRVIYVCQRLSACHVPNRLV
jgi:hypothetical protein